MAQPTVKMTALALAVALGASNLVLVEQAGVTKAAPVSLLVPPGVVEPFAGASVPAGFLLCDGSAVSRTTYSDLYAAIGTTWGTGNGSTTFNLPDMRESVPVGAGTYSAVSGTTHGAITAHDARALGVFADDQEQGHFHYINNGTNSISYGINDAGGTGANVPQGSGGPTTGDLRAQGMYANSTDGTPRTGTVTRGKTIGVNYIIKY